MADAKKKRSKRDDDPLAPYRRIRTPMPPPEVIPDRRRELEDELARREIDEGEAERSRRRDTDDEEAGGAKEEE